MVQKNKQLADTLNAALRLYIKAISFYMFSRKKMSMDEKLKLPPQRNRSEP